MVERTVIVDFDANLVGSVDVELLRTDDFSTEVTYLRLDLVGHALVLSETVHTIFVVYSVPSVTLSAPSEVEVEEVASGSVSVKHYGVSSLVGVVSAIHDWAACAKFGIDEVFPCSLALSVFVEAGAAQAEIRVESVY